jgi:hypothetical protein
MNVDENPGVVGSGAENHPNAEVEPRPVSRPHNLRDQRTGRFLPRTTPADPAGGRRPHRRVHTPFHLHTRNLRLHTKLTPAGKLKPRPIYGTADIGHIMQVSTRTVRRYLDRKLLPSFRPPNRATSQPRERLVSRAALLRFAADHPQFRYILNRMEVSPDEMAWDKEPPATSQSQPCVRTSPRLTALERQARLAALKPDQTTGQESPISVRVGDLCGSCRARLLGSQKLQP